MICITLHGKMSQFSSKLEIDPTSWDTKNGKVSGKSVGAQKINQMMDDIKLGINNIYREIERTESYVEKTDKMTT